MYYFRHLVLKKVKSCAIFIKKVCTTFRKCVKIDLYLLERRCDALTLKDKMIESIGYDPLTRMYYIEKNIKGYYLKHSSYSKKLVEEYIVEKFRVVRILKHSLPRRDRYDTKQSYHKKNSSHSKRRRQRRR